MYNSFNLKLKRELFVVLEIIPNKWLNVNFCEKNYLVIYSFNCFINDFLQKEIQLYLYNCSTGISI